MDENQEILPPITDEVQSQSSSSIQDEDMNFGEVLVEPTRFSKHEIFIGGLLNIQPVTDASFYSTEIDQSVEPSEKLAVSGSDTVYFSLWKNIENVSARLIEVYENIVVVECLIDKDTEYFEEREFSKSLFSGYDIEIGKIFFIRYFERTNEARIEIHDDPRLVSPKDFEKNLEPLKYSKLFKK